MGISLFKVLTLLLMMMMMLLLSLVLLNSDPGTWSTLCHFLPWNTLTITNRQTPVYLKHFIFLSSLFHSPHP